MTDGTTAEPDPLKAGDTAAADLDDALRRIGIVLPSLRGGWPTVNGGPLVRLGGARPETVHRLAAWVRERSS